MEDYKIIIDKSVKNIIDHLRTISCYVKVDDLGQDIMLIPGKCEVLRLLPEDFKKPSSFLYSKIKSLFQSKAGSKLENLRKKTEFSNLKKVILIQDVSQMLDESLDKYLDAMVHLIWNHDVSIIPADKIEYTGSVVSNLSDRMYQISHYRTTFQERTYQERVRGRQKPIFTIQYNKQSYLLGGLIFCSNFAAQSLLQDYGSPYEVFKAIVNKNLNLGNHPFLFNNFIEINNILLTTDFSNIKGNKVDVKGSAKLRTSVPQSTSSSQALILMDTKQPQTMDKLFHTLHCNVSKVNLNFGHYVITSEMAVLCVQGIDIKNTVHNTSRQLFDVLKQLKRACTHPIIIVENFPQAFTAINTGYNNTVYGSIKYICHDLGIPMLVTKKPVQNAVLLCKLAKQAFSNKKLLDPKINIPHPYKNASITRDDQLYFLYGFNLVGEGKAAAILDYYKTPWEFIKSCVGGNWPIKQIPLVGKKLFETNKILLL